MGQRLLILDLARSLALLGMVIFHLTYDLAMVGLIDPTTPYSGFFWYFARAIAASFLALAGVSLWLAHGRAPRPQAFWRRLLKIALAALAVTVATKIALPQAYVFFGILHAIALFSLLGYGLLRAPSWALTGLAFVVLALPSVYHDQTLFDGPLLWLGLAGYTPQTVDFEPLFPWFAAFLMGMVLGRGLTRPKVIAALALEARPLWRWLAWPGQHSLWIYLLHQPLLLGGLISLLRLGWIGP